MENKFAQITREMKANKLVMDAIPFVKEKNEAIDIGAGSLRDSKFLSESGFKHVIALDKNFSNINNKNSDVIELAESDIQDYKLEKKSFDLVVAINSLPFINKKKISSTLNEILESLKEGGVICATLFGHNDEWAKTKSDTMNFYSKSEILYILKDFDIKIFIEEEREGKTVDGNNKYWHIFRFVAVK